MNLVLCLMYFVYRKLEFHRFDVENIRSSCEILFVILEVKFVDGQTNIKHSPYTLDADVT
jgi:hypothetical protein